MKARIPVLAAVSLLFYAACGTGPAVSPDNAYLIQNVDDDYKAAALANQGIDAYTTYLVQQADYTKTDYVRQFFVVALRYDPENAKAKQYLDKVDGFKSGLVDSKLKTAQALAAKPKRKEAEDYALVSSLQTAVAIDPGNQTAVKMLKDNAALQASLADAYLKRSVEGRKKAEDKKTAEADREGLFLSAYGDAAKSSGVAAPGSKIKAQAQAQQADLAAVLGKSFDSRSVREASLLKAGKYDEAKAELGKMGAINSAMGGAKADAMQNAAYALYFQWAKALDAKSQVLDALDRLDQAIAAKRSPEALDLRKRIAVKAASSNQEAAFDSALPEISLSISRGDFAAATRKINAASKLTKDKAKLDQLEIMRGKMRDAVGGLYDAGVAAYRSEDFKTAIDKLSAVVGFNPDYEQAADYLSKAREKQKLLDQFSDQ